ncbi:hypothetical protein ACFL6I_09060 [candidate division KSB1 bacterium]
MPGANELTGFLTGRSPGTVVIPVYYRHKAVLSEVIISTIKRVQTAGIAETGEVRPNCRFTVVDVY